MMPLCMYTAFVASVCVCGCMCLSMHLFTVPCDDACAWFLWRTAIMTPPLLQRTWRTKQMLMALSFLLTLICLYHLFCATCPPPQQETQYFKITNETKEIQLPNQSFVCDVFFSREVPSYEIWLNKNICIIHFFFSLFVPHFSASCLSIAV